MKIGTQHTLQARKKMRLQRLGKKSSPETIEKLRLIHTGKVVSKKVRKKISFSLTGRISSTRGKPRPWIRGEKHPHWKGGVSAINIVIRQSLEYRLWRKAVFERDNYTCVWCLKRGVRLNADHIKPFSLYPKLRFALDNGRSLCEPCHRTTDTYGRKLLMKK